MNDLLHRVANTAKRRAARERRNVPMGNWGDAGPTVDPDRFQGADEPYPGHWRALPAPWPDLVPSPEQRTLDTELRARLDDALAGLPERQRAVITLRDVHGRPAEEVCAILEISPANQRVLLHRVRAHVRAQLEVYPMPGLDCDRLVELVTDFVEGALDPATERRVIDHPAECDGCSTYLERMRATARAHGELPPDRLPSTARDALLEAFRRR